MKLDELTFDELVETKKTIDLLVITKVRNLLTDKSKPIAERLELYNQHAGRTWTNVSTFFPRGLPRFDELYKDRLFDDFYIERHETVHFTDFIEQLEEHFDGDLDKSEDAVAVDEQFLEELFASGLTGFICDW